MTLDIREVQPEDEQALLEACGRTAGAAPSEAELRWAYAEGPLGSRRWAAIEDGRVLAFAGALPRAVWMNAAETRFAELVHAFVVPERRTGLRNPGLFVRVSEALFAAHQGFDGDAVYYGWAAGEGAAGEAWRLGRRFLRLEVVRTQVMLAREPGDGSDAAPPGVEELAGFDHQARWLWDRCSGEFGASAIRDAAFLQHRFGGRPGVRYVPLGVRDGEGVLRGYAVYRRAAWPQGEAGLVVDWLVPPQEPEVGELLLEALLARARADGVGVLRTVLPEWSPWFEAFQRAGFLALDTGQLLVARTTARRFDDLWLREGWWATLADSIVV